jgi:hypothetical protein
MPNQYVNKVIYGGTTLIDLTADTATADKVLASYTFHAADGSTKTGSCAFDVDSSDCTAAVAEVLASKTFAKNGQVLTGTMPNRGSVTGTITTKAQEYTIAQGYHDGSGTVSIDSTDTALIIPGNIKDGITILGVTGTYSGGGTPTSQTKTVTPTASQQTVLPDSGYDYLSQVTVNAVPYTETDNAAGGYTVTIL